MNGGYLLGPATDDQTPLVVTTSHQLSHFCITTDQRTVGVMCGTAGDIFIQCAEGNIGQFDAQFAPGWSVGPTGTGTKNLGVSSMAILPSGGIVVGGAVTGNGTDAAVARYDGNGTQLWQTVWSSSGLDATAAVAVAPDNSVYATGTSSGQAPGNPPTAAAGKWVAHYNADGNMLWLKQYGGDHVSAGLFLGAPGDLYMAQSQTFEKLDADGNISLNVDNSSLVLGKYPNGSRLTFPAYGVIALAADSFYTMSTLGTNDVLINMSFSGLPNWFRISEPARRAVIDPVEGTTWTGTLGGVGSAPAVVVNDEAIYIVGAYANQYMLGSNPPPTTLPIFVGRYDLSGNRVWFQEYLPEQQQYGFSPNTGGSALDPDGNLVVKADAPLLGTYLFRVSANDGTILQ